MSIFLLTLTHYSFLLLFMLVSFILGKRILKHIEFDSAWESMAFSLAFGLGGIAYIVFFVGLLQLLYTWTLALILVALVVIAIITNPSFFASVKSSIIAWRGYLGRLVAQKDILAFLGCLAAMVGSGVLLPLYPPTDWDTIEYHLSVAKIYMRFHAVVLTEFLRYPVYSQLNHMLLTLMLAFSDDLSAQLVQYLFYLLIGVLIYAYARRYFSQRAGILAAVMWLGNLLAMWENHNADVDMALVFFGTCGIFAFLNYSGNRQRNWLVISAVLLGLATAAKYTGLFWIGLCGLYSIWIGFKERKWQIPVLFGLISGLVACPFYIRNIYYTGNPFFPYIPFLFRENIWTYTDIAFLNAEQGSYGLPVTLINFIKLPWQLKANPKLFNSMFPPYNWVYLAFLPLALLFGVLKPQLRNLLIFSMSFTIFWFLTVQVTRYLMPAFPLFCLLAGVTFDHLLDTGLAFVQKKSGYHIPKWAPSLVYLMIIIPAAAVTIRVNINTMHMFGPVPTTTAQRDAYLQNRLPSYPAYQLMNTMSNGKSYRVYALFDEDMSYYSDGVFMGDWFGPGRFSKITNVLSDSHKLYTELGKLDAQYFLFQGNRDKNQNLPDDAFFHEKFRKIYDSNGVKVFEIAP